MGVFEEDFFYFKDFKSIGVTEEVLFDYEDFESMGVTEGEPFYFYVFESMGVTEEELFYFYLFESMGVSEEILFDSCSMHSHKIFWPSGRFSHSNEHLFKSDYLFLLFDYLDISNLI